jgi:hypothetical protein
MTPQNRASDYHPILSKVTDWANRAIPPILVAAAIGICGGAFTTYNAVAKITDKVAEHDRALSLMQSRIDQIEANAVKREELLAILKRVEQQLEIALLRSGVKVPPKMLSSDSK